MGRFIFRVVTSLHAKLYQLTGGRFFGGGEGGKVLVLTHTGAKTGKVRQTPLMYMPHDDGFVIIASAGGDERHPGWYHNLMANPVTAVNINGERIDVRACDAGDQRDELWAKVTAWDPRFANYEAKTDRVIPVVVLERV
ncbi:MAG: nitroreductase family deazaflavin-dependent oxidoreductase [Acidimicrobiia bacterium]|nr:nitroreductase family deazaflavin-dependent oxidoreductase [Acidimicrobiia bacterium]